MRTVEFPGPGCVVEYMQGNKPHIAWVLEDQGGKLRLLTLNKRETKLPANRLLPWSGPRHDAGLSRQEVISHLERYNTAREEQVADIDPKEIWSLAQGELGSATAQWFAELLWEDPDVEHISAMGRALLECKTHFKFRPPEFEVYPEDKVDKRLTEQAIAKEREELTVAGQAFFRDLWALHLKRRNTLPELPEPEVADKLEALLRRRIAVPDDAETAKVWRPLCAGMPEDPLLALHLAKAWGVVGPHHNHFFDLAGYEEGDAWSQPFSQDTEALREQVTARQGDVEQGPWVSVDSASTRDVDDAFCFARTEQGYQVSLALACPALLWEFGSELDRSVAQRASSVYLPEGVSHMLPESLGTDLFSLLEKQPRPALLLDLELDERGALLTCSPRLAWAEIAANLTYETVETCLECSANESGQEAVSQVERDAGLDVGHELALRLRDLRIEQGAVVVERYDPEIMLVGEGKDLKVELEVKEPPPGAQLLVSEMMILANSAIAEWAKENAISLLHRTQDVRVPKELSAIWREPHHIHRAVKALGPSILEPRPAPHASLGVPAYSPVSSPLRRYPDLINMAQVTSFLRTGQARLDTEELTSMLPGLSSRLEAVGRVQRFRPRYWKLVHFKQQKADTYYHAVVVEEGAAFVSVSLPKEQIFVRGKRDTFGEKLYAGQQLQVRLGRIDPLGNEIHILEALEE
ncbi:MAG: RNB domain-containing ribonuclease [Desulfovibrio sp.]|nr:MAG: RNB domain-containing ribonuclease [Desulfovibrio sp.]